MKLIPIPFDSDPDSMESDSFVETRNRIHNNKESESVQELGQDSESIIRGSESKSELESEVKNSENQNREHFWNFLQH